MRGGLCKQRLRVMAAHGRLFAKRRPDAHPYRTGARWNGVPDLGARGRSGVLKSLPSLKPISRTPRVQTHIGASGWPTDRGQLARERQLTEERRQQRIDETPFHGHGEGGVCAFVRDGGARLEASGYRGNPQPGWRQDTGAAAREWPYRQCK